MTVEPEEAATRKKIENLLALAKDQKGKPEGESALRAAKQLAEKYGFTIRFAGDPKVEKKKKVDPGTRVRPNPFSNPFGPNSFSFADFFVNIGEATRRENDRAWSEHEKWRREAEELENLRRKRREKEAAERAEQKDEPPDPQRLPSWLFTWLAKPYAARCRSCGNVIDAHEARYVSSHQISDIPPMALIFCGQCDLTDFEL